MTQGAKPPAQAHSGDDRAKDKSKEKDKKED
jgi:hypothetical protein